MLPIGSLAELLNPIGPLFQLQYFQNLSDIFKASNILPVHRNVSQRRQDSSLRLYENKFFTLYWTLLKGDL